MLQGWSFPAPIVAFSRYLPGLQLTALLGAAAAFLSGIAPVPTVFVALILGLLFADLSATARYSPGLDLAGRGLLRLGVAFLGVQVSLTEIAKLGVSTLVLIVGALIGILILGALIGRVFGLRVTQALVAAAAVSICGASAALALSAALPQSDTSEKDTAGAIAAVTLAGSVGMILYPWIASAFHLGPVGTGVLLGGSLHEVAQAVAAGFSVSDQTGQIATSVKLLRVACLAPVVVLIGQLFSADSRDAPTSGRAWPLPWFVLMFAVFCAARSWDLLPHPLVSTLGNTSRVCLIMAITALGAKISPRKLIAMGPRPILAVIIESAVLLGVVLGGVLLFIQD